MEVNNERVYDSIQKKDNDGSSIKQLSVLSFLKPR